MKQIALVEDYGVKITSRCCDASSRLVAGETQTPFPPPLPSAPASLPHPPSPIAHLPFTTHAPIYNLFRDSKCRLNRIFSYLILYKFNHKRTKKGTEDSRLNHKFPIKEQ